MQRLTIMIARLSTRLPVGLVPRSSNRSVQPLVSSYDTKDWIALRGAPEGYAWQWKMRSFYWWAMGSLTSKHKETLVKENAHE